MKKLGRKLVLSSLSLGLAVATLSTTTYAWYTNNTSASVTGVEGTTDATASAGLLISKTYAGNYSNTFALAEGDYTVDGSEMIPLQYKTNALTDLDEGTLATGNNKKYIQFSIFVKTTVAEGSSVDVYLESLTIENQATTLKEFDIIQSTYTDWAASATKYSVDAAQALNIAFATADTPAEGDTHSTDIGTTEYSVNDIVTKKSQTGLTTTSNALGYYNAVMGGTPISHTSTVQELKTITPAASTTAAQAIPVATLAGGAISEIVVTIWLDGWDQFCFDACKGQAFNISLALTTELDKVAVIKKPAA